ncbi:hypothetical protein [Nonomuraea cavernae]|uniref:Serine/threonine protein kinase n=1 Tax=Nonomuraea cavernae TaxID=2045107 RepID=A0A917YV85_9ACTN|nr:hypothetical protein [Nonomuraea cavernae]MCA2186689.1 hypothetical protein [Nonomuraea cavernae]GGO67881.1 hypothetical protein GCM10012289_25400 [Nonomuraea cavernae]
MSRLGPVITLAAGAVLAAGLGVASTTATPAADPTAATGTAPETAPETAGEPAENPATSGDATPPAGEPSASAKPTPTETTATKIDYAGRVPGNGGLIAISIRGGKAIGYFCDGRTEAWFKGTAGAGKVGLEGFGGAEAGATLGGGKAKGWLKVGGKKWSFDAPTVKKPSGLYRATAQVRGARIRAGWIMLARPQGGFTQVGTAFVDERQLDVPELNSEQPTAPVTVDQATLYPKDVDGFIQEMR